jgi:hypothetical protein
MARDGLTTETPTLKIWIKEMYIKSNYILLLNMGTGD